MTEAKTIKLLLSNGSLSGLLVAELLKWDGILFSSPRSSYQLLSEEPEAKFWGVYLLVSQEKVYIGQANDLMRRIAEHDRSKPWWEKVILLTTKDNSLNRSDIDYLENKLINIARSTNTLEMNNVQLGNSPKVSRYRETELKDYLDGGLLLLELIGINVFKIKTNIHNEPSKDKLLKDKEVNTTQIVNIPIINNLDYMTKSKSVEYLTKEHKLSFTDGSVSFGSLQEKKSTYWLNPNVEFLKRNWYIILNNQVLKELTILQIPPYTFSTIQDDENRRLITRNDKPYYIDLNISQNDLIDLRSKCNFSIYIKKVVRY